MLCWAGAIHGMICLSHLRSTHFLTDGLKCIILSIHTAQHNISNVFLEYDVVVLYGIALIFYIFFFFVFFGLIYSYKSK